MNKLINKYWTWALSISLGVSVYLFWAYPYKSVLSYQEQYQLFLFGEDYFLERIALPGGLADYIGEFLTQFYYIPVFGAAILGIIFFCLQRLTWVVCRRCGADTQWFPLSFIPALALWMYMGDENVLLCFAVSLSGYLGIHVALYASREPYQDCCRKSHVYPDMCSSNILAIRGQYPNFHWVRSII